MSMINNLFLGTMQEGVAMATGLPGSYLSELPLLAWLRLPLSPFLTFYLTLPFPLIFLVCLRSHFVELSLPASGLTSLYLLGAETVGGGEGAIAAPLLPGP